MAIDGSKTGYGRRLAEPNLIARSGETSSFLAGGEFPSHLEQDGTITVSYKKFGVGLDFTPTVLSDGLISLDIEPEVSADRQHRLLPGGKHCDPGLLRPPCPDVGRSQERPELHDRRPPAERETISSPSACRASGNFLFSARLFVKAYQRARPIS